MSNMVDAVDLVVDNIVVLVTKIILNTVLFRGK